MDRRVFIDDRSRQYRANSSLFALIEQILEKCNTRNREHDPENRIVRFHLSTGNGDMDGMDARYENFLPSSGKSFKFHLVSRLRKRRRRMNGIQPILGFRFLFLQLEN